MVHHHKFGIRFSAILVFCALSFRAVRCDRDLPQQDGAQRPQQSSSHSSSSSSQEQQPAGDIQTECSQVQQAFVKLKLGQAGLVPTSKIHDEEMEVCYKGSRDTSKTGCCNRRMERKYHSAAEETFMEVMRQTSSYLKNLMTANAAHYQDQFLQMISASENATTSIFTDTYKIPLRDGRAPVDSLFLDLAAYIKRRDVSLHDSVVQFFDELFPLIFHYTLYDPTVIDLDEDYTDCLMEIRQELFPRPFGDIPARLGHQLSRSFGAARAFLEAMNLGIETVNTTDYLSLDHSCSRGAMRLTYCSHCDALLDVRPCKDFCLNVMRGCLAHVMNLDASWNAFVDGLEQLTANMKGWYDMEEAMQTFPSRVSEAIMHTMETAHKFNPQVVKKCGHPKTSSQKHHHGNNNGGSTPKLHPHSRNSRLLPPAPPKSEVKLHSKLEMLMRNLVASKGFYSKLPETLCNSEQFAAQSEDQCWNAQGRGSYTERLADADLSSQVSHNPEVRVSETASPTLVTLMDKLAHVRKVLSSKVNNEMMQGDEWAASYNFNYKYQEENSGHYNPDKGYYPVDDEDTDFSGSGSGDGWNPRNERPSYRTEQKSRQGSKSGNPDEDFGFEDGKSPYITSNTPKPGNSHQGGESAAPPGSPSSTYATLLTTLVVFTISLWLNG